MKVNKLHHASICVSDVPRAQKFYTEILGLEVDPNRPDFGFDGVWLKAGGAQVHLIAPPKDLDVGTRPVNFSPVAPHFALRVDDLAASRTELEAAGLEILTFGDFSEQLWIRDPDGNIVELTTVS